jgi:glycosyltransferase involved in cell wall biosynthesis
MSQEDIALHRPMRLLFVVDSLHVGGAERHAVSLASSLAQQGHHVTLACSVEGALTPLAEQGGVEVRPLLRHLVKRRFSSAYAWKLAHLVRQGQFDLVHAHMYASDVASSCATLGTDIPLIITEHSEAQWRSPYARQGSRWCYARTKRVIAVSRAIRRRLTEQDGVPYERVSVIMNALPHVPELPRDTQSVLPGAFGQRPLVGVAARLQPEKGVRDFLEAAAHVLQVVPHAHFLVIGDGPLRRDLQAYAAKLSLQERVHFLGFRMDARALVGVMDVLVVPSLTEGTPLVTLEAMSAGVPVVASAVGGIPEQIRHFKEGILVPASNAAALGEAVVHLLQYPWWAQALGEAGRKRVLSDFDFASMVQETEAVYRGALGWQTRSETTRQERDDLLTEAGS